MKQRWSNRMWQDVESRLTHPCVYAAQARDWPQVVVWAQASLSRQERIHSATDAYALLLGARAALALPVPNRVLAHECWVRQSALCLPLDGAAQAQWKATRNHLALVRDKEFQWTRLSFPGQEEPLWRIDRVVVLSTGYVVIGKDCGSWIQNGKMWTYEAKRSEIVTAWGPWRIVQNPWRMVRQLGTESTTWMLQSTQPMPVRVRLEEREPGQLVVWSRETATDGSRKTATDGSRETAMPTPTEWTIEWSLTTATLLPRPVSTRRSAYRHWIVWPTDAESEETRDWTLYHDKDASSYKVVAWSRQGIWTGVVPSRYVTMI